MTDIDVKSFLDEAARLKAEYDKLLNEKGQDALKGFFKSIFDSCPDLLAIHWTQYTPYFNDGDSCEFGVGEPEFKIATTDELKESDYGFRGYQSDLMTKVYCDGPARGERWGPKEDTVYEEIDYSHPIRYRNPGDRYDRTKYEPTGKFYTYVYDKPEYEQVEKAVFEFFHGIPQEVFLAAFGDHAEVNATRNGFEVDEYQHD